MDSDLQMITEVFWFLRLEGSHVVNKDSCSLLAALDHTDDTFVFFS